MVEIHVEDSNTNFEFKMLAPRVPIKDEFILHKGITYSVTEVAFASKGAYTFVRVTQMNKAIPFPM